MSSTWFTFRVLGVISWEVSLTSMTMVSHESADFFLSSPRGYVYLRSPTQAPLSISWFVTIDVVLRNMSFTDAQGKFSTVRRIMSLLISITRWSGYLDFFTFILFPWYNSRNFLVPRPLSQEWFSTFLIFGTFFQRNFCKLCHRCIYFSFCLNHCLNRPPYKPWMKRE